MTTLGRIAVELGLQYSCEGEKGSTLRVFHKLGGFRFRVTYHEYDDKSCNVTVTMYINETKVRETKCNFESLLCVSDWDIFAIKTMLKEYLENVISMI